MKLFFISLTLLLSFHSEATIKLAGLNYLTNKSEEIKTTQDYRVVVFLSDSCPCSNSHVAHLEILSKKYKQIQFIGIHSNQDQSIESGQSYFKQAGLSFPVLRDKDAHMADELGALKTPHVFVLDKQDNVLYAGPVSDSSNFSHAKRKYLDEFLESVLSGKKFEKISKRPLGCYIVRES